MWLFSSSSPAAAAPAAPAASPATFAEAPGAPRADSAAIPPGRSAGPAAPPTREEITAFITRVSSQVAAQSPEVVARAKAQGELQQRLQKHKKKAAVMSRQSNMTRHAWKSAMSRPAQEVQEARSCMQALQAVNGQMADDLADMDEAEAALDALEEQHGAASNGDEDEDEMRALLDQLRVEPASEAESAAKFGLYEEYLTTVEQTRRTTLEFWASVKPDFPAQAQAHLQKAVTKLDSHDAMAADFDETGRRWFVYDMTVAAHRNNAAISKCLDMLRGRLEMMQGQEECPVCLERLEGAAGVHTMGCCHQVCAPCWRLYQAAVAQPACPLCRHEDFVGQFVHLSADQ
mmetsp:Transcript_50754/g.111080  ORF Transcript_50754/g.111080 Transcript_50754/m.111080 type:complete len:346 (+) Transcript_50754:42-1079(+)